jgi:hypothetical protein
MIPGVNETFDKLKRIHASKNTDYSESNDPFSNFTFAEHVSNIFKSARDKVYATMIGIKLARLSIVLYKSPNHESVEDTFDDAIVYLTIWKADYMSRGKPDIRSITEAATLRETKVNEHP